MRRKKISNNLLKSAGNTPVVASIVVLVAFIAGLLLGTLVVAKSTGGGGMMLGGYADGWNAAKTAMKKANLPGFGEVKSLAGQVESVNGTKIVFSTYLSNPLWDKSLATRIAIVTNSTVITVRTPLSPQQVQDSQQAAQTKIADLRSQIEALNAKTPQCSPRDTATSTCNQNMAKLQNLQNDMMTAQRLMMNMYTEATGSIQDIAAGDNISVISAGDISEVAQFGAQQIIISKNPSPVKVPATAGTAAGSPAASANAPVTANPAAAAVPHSPSDTAAPAVNPAPGEK